MNDCSYFSDEQHADSVSQLARCIATESPVLMVGAGLSKLVDYPLWHELMDKLTEFLNYKPTPDVMQLLDNNAYDLYADHLHLAYGNEISKDWDAFLEHEFSPKKPAFLPDIHQALVSLPFCGIVTTNYDNSMEEAVTAYRAQASRYDELAEDDLGCSCGHLDLCNSGHKRHVFQMIRQMYKNKGQYRDNILHLHGHHMNIGSIILRRSQYNKAYGSLFDSPDNPLTATDIPHHHYVLWSLLATKSFVFMGFGLNDQFFRAIQSIVKDRFELGSCATCIAHYAVMDDANCNGKVEKDWRSAGILPVKYSISQNGKRTTDDYRKGLSVFIAKLTKSVVDIQNTLVDNPRTTKMTSSNGESTVGDISVLDVTRKILDSV